MSIEVDKERPGRDVAKGAKEMCDDRGETSKKRVNPIIAALARQRGVKNSGNSFTENECDLEKNKRRYKRECSLILNILEKQKIDVDDLLDEIEEICGKRSVLACVPCGENVYELTLVEENHASVLVPSFMMGTIEVHAKKVYESTVNVSILHMSTQIPNSAIEYKLKQFGVELVSPITERFYKNRDGQIADGTRYFTVKFPEDRKSLPYSIRFEVNGLMKHYRVKHDNMQKVCLICSSSDHLARKCPRNRCYACNYFGHIAQDCPDRTCYECGAYSKWCTCKQEKEYHESRNLARNEDKIDAQNKNEIQEHVTERSNFEKSGILSENSEDRLTKSDIDRQTDDEDIDT